MMSFKNSAILTIIIVVSLFAGCTYVTKDYKASVKNVKNIRDVSSASGVKVHIKNLSVTSMNNTTIMCRLDGSIVPPGDQTFESYIRDALVNEFTYAGIYAEDSKVYLNIVIDELDFSSTTGKWQINATVSSNDKKEFRVESEYDYETYYIASWACCSTAEHFHHAVRKFVRDLIAHPEFKGIVK